MKICRIFKCKICGNIFYVPWNNYIAYCSCHEHGYSEEITIKDATHRLSCKHCLNSTSEVYYEMDCILLKEMPGNYVPRVKILVFGERNKKGYDDKKQIRYVDKYRVSKKKPNVL